MESTGNLQQEEFWTWKDTLYRIQHIDTIIDTIVSRAIALNVAILVFFSALIVCLTSKDSSAEPTLVKIALFIVLLFGIGINLIFVKTLARQEWIRKWYFSIFPKKENDDIYPLMPHEKWLERNIQNIYSMAEPKPLVIKRPSKFISRYLYTLGKMRPGYGETWLYLLFLMSVFWAFLSILVAVFLKIPSVAVFLVVFLVLFGILLLFPFFFLDG